MLGFFVYKWVRVFCCIFNIVCCFLVIELLFIDVYLMVRVDSVFINKMLCNILKIIVFILDLK